MHAWVELGPSLDVNAWARRHAAGHVPDAAPYGLDRLVRHGVTPRFRAPVRGRLARTASRALRRLADYQLIEGITQVPAGTDVAVAWDERAGVPRALRSPSVPLATGMIWVGEPDAGHVELAAARRALPRAALVWVLSRAQLPVLAELGVAPGRRAHLIFGVDADFFAAAPADVAEPGLVVSVGNDRHRDWPTLLDAFERVRAVRPEARLELVTRHPVPPRRGVTVHPSLTHEDLRTLYARANVVAVITRPNLHVSGMTAALEGKAVGRPVLLSSTDGADDYVHAGEGRLVAPGSVEAVRDALLELLDGGQQAVRTLGASGRESVEAVHSTERQAERLAALLREHC